ncbi:SLOG family protein [Streptomyces lavendulae]|uniref:SLOG family protein n=1 Tax=Streptomyces lavendulae TaxID=1914 RepID=UPI0036A5ABCB
MTDRPYRILVTGTPDWDDSDAICQALDDAVRAVPPHTRDVWLVVGDCQTGADRIAYQWAVAAGVPVDAHLADRTIRGEAMVKSGADLVLAFIRDDSRGASHTVDLARRAGIPVRLWTAP